MEEVIGPSPFPKKKFIEPVEFEASLKNLEKVSEESTIPLDTPSAKPQQQANE